MIINNKEYKVGVILTQWKRQNLEKQLIQIKNQTVKIDFIIVFQNENHHNISNIIKKYDVIHVKSDYNTKFFGRFAYFFSIPVDICIVMDDDIIPGNNCIKNYVIQCISLNAIIGGNGRLCCDNKNCDQNHSDGLRNIKLFDFVGHLWCFKKDWLYYMFSVKPFTYDTGEDMHLCFSSKVIGNINSYIGAHKDRDCSVDLTQNGLASDKFSSYKTISKQLRKQVQDYWVKKGLKFIESN